MYLQTTHAQAQQRLQAKSDECLKLYKQLEGQTQVINTIEEELGAVRLEFAAIDKKVAHNEAHGKGLLVMTAWKHQGFCLVAASWWLFFTFDQALAFVQWPAISQKFKHLSLAKASC